VQVGTALFADPAAPVKIQADLSSWAHRRGIGCIDQVGALA
jgi:dihydroorotate dehydrogenase